MIADDPFAGFDTEEPISAPENNTSANSAPQGAAPQSFGRDSGPRPQGGGGFAQEIFSVSIEAKFRKFFLDLKQSSNGKFIKVSEKSRGGQKSTIMFDAEDIDQFISALQSIKSHL